MAAVQSPSADHTERPEIPANRSLAEPKTRPGRTISGHVPSPVKPTTSPASPILRVVTTQAAQRAAHFPHYAELSIIRDRKHGELLAMHLKHHTRRKQKMYMTLSCPQAVRRVWPSEPFRWESKSRERLPTGPASAGSFSPESERGFGRPSSHHQVVGSMPTTFSRPLRLLLGSGVSTMRSPARAPGVRRRDGCLC